MNTTTQIIEAIEAQMARMANRDRADWRGDLEDMLAAFTVRELRNVLIAKFKPMTGRQSRDDVVAAVLDLYVPEEATATPQTRLPKYSRIAVDLEGKTVKGMIKGFYNATGEYEVRLDGTNSATHALKPEQVRPLTEDEINAEQYDRAITQIKRLVDELNKALGYEVSDLTSGFSKDGLTFGYIGNLEYSSRQGGKGDDRSFMVSLPHPGRPGNYDDRFGGFSYGNLAGARDCLAQLAGALRFAKWQKSQANGGFPVRSPLSPR